MIEAMVVVLAGTVLAAQWWARATIRSLDALATGKLPTGEATALALLDAAGAADLVVRPGRRDGFDPLRGAVVLSDRHRDRRSLAAVAVSAHAAALAVTLRAPVRRGAWVAARVLARAGGIAIVVLGVLGLFAPHGLPVGVPIAAMLAALAGFAACVVLEGRAATLAARVLAGADVPTPLLADLQRVAFSAAIGGLAGTILPPVPTPRWPDNVPGANPGHDQGVDGIRGHDHPWNPPRRRLGRRLLTRRPGQRVIRNRTAVYGLSFA